MDVSKENEKLQEEIDRLQDRNFRVEERANEHEVRIKELEVLLALAPNNPTVPKIVKLDRENRGDLYADEDRERTLQENQRLRDSLRRYEEEIAVSKAAHEQQLAVHEARQSEQQAQIGELLQAESVRQRASGHNSGKGSGQDYLQEHHEPILKENEQSSRFRSKGEPVVVDKLAKDKMESVEDVMRVLEAVWVNEEETKRHLQKLSRQNADLVSMLGNGDQHVKEEELRGHIRSLDEREEQRQRDINEFQAEKDRLADQVDDLRHAIKQKDDKIRDLQDRLGMLENRLKEDEFNQRKQTDTPKDGVMEDRMRKLEAAVAQKKADMNGLAKGRDKRLQELNDQLATMREANDGLWKQLVALQDEKQDSRGRSSGGFSPRTPRSSARRRSMEHLVYSQPTTQTSEERKRTVVADGAHLAVTIVELSDVLRNGRPITEPGFIIIKVKSVKEKYKTSVKELASVIRFDETFVFYLAQPDEDIITLHVFYKPKTSSREYHIGDASFTMATLHRGVPRQRIAIVAQNPGTRDARRAAQVEVIMQSDDFGKMTVPTEAEIEDEKLRFNELLRRVEVSSPEDLHHADVMMTMNNRQ
ncbi:viral A-type inclusion protein [Trypanosoma grayi]|uniref:viral A-type inclusion protein n=1 Tax=Trypanosoma grayi TaxID=71804 RepID=UPI0004F49553|nr:viral A-type inclusion protein [Trypanosoma grayi]KEG08627.1 viral A-type inclusion protein [Trypanosoma grayi]